MSTLYLVDAYGNPFSTSPITDVREGPNAAMTGAVVVRVPDAISVVSPQNASDLITKKYTGVLAANAGYANIHYDDLMDLADVDVGAMGVRGVFGERNVVSILPGGIFQSTAVALTGANPVQALVSWEVYSVTLSDDKAGRVQQTYVEEPSSPSTFACEVSFDGGAHFYTTYNNSLLNIPVPGQGTQFVIRLTNSVPLVPRALRIGSWAVVY